MKTATAAPEPEGEIPSWLRGNKKVLKYDKLLEKFDNSKDAKKVDILWDALGYMQQYNGRSYHDCIVLAMGGTWDDVNDYHMREG